MRAGTAMNQDIKSMANPRSKHWPRLCPVEFMQPACRPPRPQGQMDPVHMPRTNLRFDMPNIQIKQLTLLGHSDNSNGAPIADIISINIQLAIPRTRWGVELLTPGTGGHTNSAIAWRHLDDPNVQGMRHAGVINGGSLEHGSQMVVPRQNKGAAVYLKETLRMLLIVYK